MHPYASRNAASGTQQAAQALRTALANPYQSSSHYSQAYFSQQASGSTPEGYAYSSTYAHSLPTQPQQSSAPRPPPRAAHAPHQSRGGGNRGSNQRGQQQQTHWYEPGDHRCNYEGCMFTGARKSVEIHMMDRHLIYPSGWDKRKKKREWDADPSLLKSGKPIPIQGTSLVLDTSEAIEAWIAERRKRWPTTAHVDEKEKKLKDAIERGEITATDPSLRGRKRPRTDDSYCGKGPARGKGRGQDDNSEGARVPRAIHPLPAKPVVTLSVTAHVSEDESSSSGSDIDPEKDAISSKAPPGFAESLEKEAVSKLKEEDKTLKDARLQSIRPMPRRAAPQPRAQKKNPFANRPSLFHNLLLPEIRMTVSNLSQAIHFLVENDFLQDVELNPGDAENKPIEVISETGHETT